MKENAARSRDEPEFELLDTGIFAGRRYFDIEIEYARDTPEQTLIRITATNLGPEEAPLHLIPQLWFRNTWAWADTPSAQPVIELLPQSGNAIEIACAHGLLGTYYLAAAGSRAGALHQQRNQLPAALQRPQPEPVREGCLS